VPVDNPAAHAAGHGRMLLVNIDIDLTCPLQARGKKKDAAQVDPEGPFTV
jgi:hypothetical protein